MKDRWSSYSLCMRNTGSVVWKNKVRKPDKKLKELNEKLTYSSLGLEHFFQDKNMFTLSEKVLTKENQLEDILDKLSKTMAEILLEGEAIEILDGDVVHCPVL